MSMMEGGYIDIHILLMAQNAVGGKDAGVCHNVLVVSYIVLISGKTIREGLEGVKMSTMGSEHSDTSSTWSPRFWATLLKSSCCTLLSSRMGATEVPATTLSGDQEDNAQTSAGHCSYPSDPKGSCGASSLGSVP